MNDFGDCIGTGKCRCLHCEEVRADERAQMAKPVATKWRQVVGSQPGDQELIFTIPCPDEDEGVLELRLVVYQCKDNKPSRRWRAHAKLGKNELFRFFAPTLGAAELQVEQSMRKVLKDLLKGLKP